MKNRIRIFRKADAAVIAVCLVLAAVFFALSYGRGDAEALISVDGQVLYSINLRTAEDRVYELSNGVTIQVIDHKIGFTESDCAGKDCIRCGMLSSPGQTAVCIPNKTIIKLQGENRNQPDAMVY